MAIFALTRTCTPVAGTMNFTILVDGFMNIRFMHSVYPIQLWKEKRKYSKTTYKLNTFFTI